MLTSAIAVVKQRPTVTGMLNNAYLLVHSELENLAEDMSMTSKKKGSF